MPYMYYKQKVRIYKIRRLHHFFVLNPFLGFFTLGQVTLYTVSKNCPLCDCRHLKLIFYCTLFIIYKNNSVFLAHNISRLSDVCTYNFSHNSSLLNLLNFVITCTSLHRYL